MKSTRSTVLAAAVASLALIGATSIAAAQENGRASRVEVSVMGGVQALNRNDTAVPDHFINIPTVASLTYHLTPILAVEGDFTWMIPLEQKVDLGSGTEQKRKTPDILAYQADLRASLPSYSWTPYLAAGVGAVTVLSNTDADRVPQLAESQTMFAINFGPGVSYGLAPRWALRADFRELVAFPSKDAKGLSTNGNADPLWMERGTVGVAYRF